MTLVGNELKAGDKAPDFYLCDSNLGLATLNDVLAGNSRAALLIVVPSVDTSVCALETVKFNKHVKELPTEKIATYTISVDLPFAQKRFTSSERVANLSLLSAYRDHCFGPNYGVFIKELGLLARSIFLIDSAGIIRSTFVMSEVAMEPDYDAALKEARAIVGI
jgi:thiol peroxidase